MQDISKEILIQASTGDTEAFEKIYKAASVFVYNVALRIANNKQDAQEVTQDVFLKIYAKLKHFQFRSSFKTWVYRITVNTAINTYRRTSRRNKCEVSYNPAVKYENVNQQRAETIDREDNQRLLTSLLNMLNPDQRSCIVLREITGLNYKQISAALGININTVRSRLKRAREAILANKNRGGVR